MVNSREYEFRWNEWNVEHIAEPGVFPDEAEHWCGALVDHFRDMSAMANGELMVRVPTGVICA